MYEEMQESAFGQKNSIQGSIYIILGRFIGNVRKYKDCKIEIIFQSRTKFNHKVLGSFQVSNLIYFNPLKTKYSPENDFLNDIKILITRNGNKIATGKTEAEIISGHHLYSRTIELDDVSFQIVYYVSGLDEERKMTVSIDKPGVRCFPSSVLSQMYNFLPPRVDAVVDGKPLNSIPVKIYSSMISHDEWLRELSVYIATDHPNICKLCGYECDRMDLFSYLVEHPEHETICSNRRRKLSFRNIMTGVFSAMSHMNSLGFYYRSMKPWYVMLDANDDVKISNFKRCHSIEEEMEYSIIGYRMFKQLIAENYYDFRFDAKAVGEIACLLFNRLNDENKVVLFAVQGRYIKGMPYQTQVILRAMFSKELIMRPTFFELAILLNLGHFHLAGDKGEKMSEIFDSNYETANDYLHYKRSMNAFDRLHCVVFDLFHGNFDEVLRVAIEGSESDKYLRYICDYMILCGSANIEDRKKEELYKEFISFDSDDYRFWLMPPPNLMPRNTEDSFDQSMKRALGFFHRAHDQDNYDPSYEKFFDAENLQPCDILGNKFFNYIRMFPKMRKYVSLYYLDVCRDRSLSFFYYNACSESEKEEVVDILITNASGGNDFIQHFLLFGRISKDERVRSRILSKLNINSVRDPKVLFKAGICCIERLDYENGKRFIDLSVDRNYQLAIFYKSLLTFHGHCYHREREESLKSLITSGKILGGKYALEVAKILLQGIYIEQNIEVGEDLLHLSGFGNDGDNRKVSLYDRLLGNETKFSQNHNEVGFDELLNDGNPKSLLNLGKQTYVGASVKIDAQCQYIDSIQG